MNHSPAPLHIPDGFLNIVISVAFWLATILIVGLAIRKSKATLKERHIPLMGIMAAFIFAAQMINFPVAGGTSGHLLGGALAAVVLGPWSGILVMTSVISLQALLFQDGGLLVMGANIFNMGILTALIGYGLFQIVKNQDRGIQFAGIAAAAWLSVLAGALTTSFQLWLSSTSPAGLVFPAMLGVHLLIGIGEALITVAAFAFITQVRPDILRPQSAEGNGKYGWVIVGSIISLLVVLISPFASTDPDGLERVAENLGFLGQAQDTPFSFLPDYTIPFLGETEFSTIVAGLVGIIIIGLIAFFIGKAVQKPAPVEEHTHSN